LHKNLKTTEIYTHVSNRNIGKIKSPLDNLKIKRDDVKMRDINSSDMNELCEMANWEVK